MADRSQREDDNHSLAQRVQKAIREAAQFEEQHTPEDSQKEKEQVNPNASLEDIKQNYEIEELKEIVQGRRHADEVHKMRKKFAPYLFGLVCFWLVVVSISVFLSGFALWGFNLSDKVIITFIATTTANVLGLFYVVAKWLYPNGDGKSQEKKNR